MNSGLEQRTEFSRVFFLINFMEKDFRGLSLTTKQCHMLPRATARK